MFSGQHTIDSKWSDISLSHALSSLGLSPLSSSFFQLLVAGAAAVAAPGVEEEPVDIQEKESIYVVHILPSVYIYTNLNINIRMQDEHRERERLGE